MKTIFAFLALIFLFISLNAQDAIFNKLPDGVAPVIDGSIDELWDTIETHYIERPYVLDFAPPTIDSAKWKATWNDTSIFVLVEVYDDNHCDEWCSEDIFWRSDRVEIYFDVNDTLLDGGGPGNTPGHYQFVVDFKQDTVSAVDTVLDIPFEYYRAYILDNTNYKCEFEIPIESLLNKYNISLNPNTIDEIGFDVDVTDRDEGDPDRKRLVWRNDGSDFVWGFTEAWNNMDYCGIVTFTKSNPTIYISGHENALKNNSLLNLRGANVSEVNEAIITIKNTGQQNLEISAVNISGDGFSVGALANSTLSKEEEQTLTISFSASDEGSYEGTLEIISNDVINSSITINLLATSYYNVSNGKAEITKLPTGTEPIIDGTIDELWDSLGIRYINKNFIHNNSDPTIDLARWRATWNDTAIYFLVEVFDDQFCNEWCSGAPGYESDRITIYMDINNELKDIQGPAQFPNGHFEFAPWFFENQNTGYNRGADWQGKFFTYAYIVEGSNYRFEVAIPIDSLKDKDGNTLDPLNIDEIGFDVGVTDRDSYDWGHRVLFWENDGISDQKSNAEVLVDWGDFTYVTRFKPGVEFYEGALDKPAGSRTYFGMGSDIIDSLNNEIINYFPLTDNAKKIYLAEIQRMLGSSNNIIYITENDRDDQNIAFLKSNGFNIITFWPGTTLGDEPQSTIDMLNQAGLIIIGRSCHSINFEQENDREAWNNLTAPLMLISPWIARSNRLNWFNSVEVHSWQYEPDTINAYIYDISDPIFADVQSEIQDNWIDWFKSPPHDHIWLPVPRWPWEDMDDCGTLSFIQTEPLISVLSENIIINNNSEINLGGIGLDSTKEVNIKLINRGKNDLTISSVNITGLGYNVSGLTDSILSKNEIQPLTITVTGTKLGITEGTLEIVSDDLINSTYTITYSMGTSIILENGEAGFKKLPAGTVPTIDGEIDALWNDVGVYSIDKPFQDHQPTLDLATWQAVWNDTAIFVLVRVNEDLHCDEWCSGNQNWDSDKPEIWFDVNERLKDGRGADVETGHYQFAPAWEQNTDTFYSDTIDLKGNAYEYAYTLDNANYIFEYQIPINTLVDRDGDTLNPATIDEIGFDVDIIDRDKAEEERNLAVWKNDIEFNWFNMDSAGKAIFIQYDPSLSVISKKGGISNDGTFSLGYTDTNTIKNVQLRIRNLGETQLNINSVSIAGVGFSFVDPSPVALDLFESQSMIIMFEPTGEGIFTGTLTINSDDPINPAFIINLRIGVGLTIIEGGPVSGTWKKDESPYHIEGNITIPDDSTLTIEDSVEVIFQGPYYFQIDGQLLAKGTETDSILFTRNDTTGFYIEDALDGGWQGFFINNDGQMNDNDSTILKYCIIEYAKAYEAKTKWSQGAALYVNGFSDVLIDHCLIQNNKAYYDGGAICANQFADIDIYNSTIINNTSLWGQGGAIYVVQGSKPNLYNNTISYNTTGYRAAIFAGSGTLCEIYNNEITNNRSLYETPGGIYLELSNSYIVNNVISNNQAADNGAACIINNCLPIVANNNICYNRAEMGTGGVVLWGLSQVDFVNNIFWGNVGNDSDSTQFDIGSAQPNFYNCVVQDGLDSSLYTTFTGDSVDIYTDDPQFVVAPDSAGADCDISAADWNISNSSIVINQGKEIVNEDVIFDKDIYENNRIVHSYVDIGAVESHIESINYTGDTIFYDTYWVADTVKVNGEIFVTDSATLKIAPGTMVEFQDYYKFKMRGVLLSRGLPDAMIKFTINDATNFDDIQSDEGAWGGIALNDDYWDGANFEMQNNDSTIIDYTIIEYAKNMTEDWSMTEGGAIQIEYVSKVRVSNCIIRNNIAAIGGGISIQGFANPVIKNNKFYNNFGRSEGGAICIKISSKPLINNNLITNNKTEWGSGSIYIYQSNPIIINNIICNNSEGFHIESSYPDFLNNTIVNNAGDAIYIYDCNPKFYNSIFWGNNGAEIWAGNNNNPEIYNCIIEEGIEGIGPWERKDEFITSNLIKKYPQFVDPTDGYGTTYNGLNANWSVTDLSPVINNGILLEDIDLPATDIKGNPRINYDSVDIGAIENQGKPITILSQPIPQTVCVGDSITLTFRITGVAQYQWKKNDKDIPLETNSTFEINPTGINDEGNYTCVVTNGYGSVETNTALISVQTAPYILVQPEFSEVCEGDSAQIELSATGAVPITYQWYKNNIAIQNATTYQYKIENATILNNAGVYHCIVSNQCGDSYSDLAPLIVHKLPVVNIGVDDTLCWNEESVLDPGEFELYKWNDFTTDRYKLVEDTGAYSVKVTDMFGCENTSNTINISIKEAYTPEIFLVTVDTTEGTEGKNLIVWEKPDATDILSFNIYKETTTAGEYKKLGERAYSDSNIFVDQYSSPEVKADRYKLSIVDVCGETEMSKHHKTIHLSQNEQAGGDGVNLQWNHYEGFEFGTYYIYKGNSKNSLILYDSIQSNLNSYTDTVPQKSSTIQYQISVKRDSSINLQTGKKASAGPYARSASNMEDNRLRTSAPANIELSGNIIYENLSAGYQIGVLSTFDEDAGDVHTYSIVSGDEYFDISGSTLISAVEFDYEVSDQYTITIKVIDSAGDTLQEDFTIVILNVDEKQNAIPSDIQITINRIEEGLPDGSQVGVLFTIDDDEVHTYTLVNGDDNFDISGSSLLTKKIFDYETQSEYTIRVKTTDPDGETYEKDITIYISDKTETDINNATLTNNIAIYPNPVKEILYIVHSLNNLDEYSISIINSVGNVVYFNTYFDNEIEINIAKLKNGMYIIRLSNENYSINKRFTIIK